MPVDEFALAVTTAYAGAQRTLNGQDAIEQALRRCHSYPVFQEAIQKAGAARSVLILGCGGDGLIGLPADYARREWLRVWPGTERLDSLNLTCDLLADESRWPDGGYDVVVSHSMLLYFFRLDRGFEFISRALRSGGIFLMGKEVNARFWQEPALPAATRQLREERRAQRGGGRFGLPLRLLRAAKRRLLASPSPDLTSKVNQALRAQYGATGCLTEAEISRLIEIHRPTDPPSSTQIGMSGFEVDALQRTVLSEFDLIWWRTSGWLGYASRENLSTYWLGKEGDLGSVYPFSGIYLSACWRKCEQPENVISQEAYC